MRGAQVAGEYRWCWQPARRRRLVRDAGPRLESTQRAMCFLEGRADDLIVRGGENISPGEIEEALLAHPAVADACLWSPCRANSGVKPSAPWWSCASGATASVAAGVAAVGARAPALLAGAGAICCSAASYPTTKWGKILRRVVREELLRQAIRTSARSAPS